MPPTLLINSLETIRRRAKTLSILFGVGLLLAAAIGILLAAVLIDYALKLPVPPRLLVLLAAVAAVAFLAWRWIVRPVPSRLSLSEVAGHVESVFPEFDDRLRSTVDFVQQPDAIPGSAVMKDRVVSEATTLAQTVDLRRALVTKPVWYSVGGGVAALAALLILSLSLSDLAKIAGNRLLLGAAVWPKRVEIDAAPVPRRVPVGQRLDVSLALKKGDRASQKSLVYYQYDDGPVIKEYMIRGDTGRYTASIDARSGAKQLKVWMAAGDDETAPTLVDVVPRLAIERVDATITPPAYAQMPPT